MARQYKKHGERKADLLATAQKLFSEKSYEQATIADIIETAGVSKGAFYHYFKSKEEILDCLVEEMVHHVVEHLGQVVTDKTLSAHEKLRQFFQISRVHKFENRELIMAYLRMMLDDRNCLMIQKARRHSASHVAPFVQQIIDQGVSEGVFRIPQPQRMAELLLGLWQVMGDMQAETLFRFENRPELADRICENLKIFESTVERLLGAATGSVHLADEKKLRLLVEQWVRPANEGESPGHN